MLADLLDLYDKPAEIRDVSCESILQRKVPVFFIDFLPVSLDVIDQLILDKICDHADPHGRARVELLLKKAATLFHDLEAMAVSRDSRWRKWSRYLFNSREYYRLRQEASLKTRRERFLLKVSEFIDEMSALFGQLEANGARATGQ